MKYEEVVPDISDVVDNIYPLQKNSKSSQNEYKAPMLSKSSALLPMPNTLNRNLATYHQQLEIDSCVPKIPIIDPSKEILDHNTVLPFKINFSDNCQNCIVNHAVMTYKGYNEQEILPKNSGPIILSLGNDQCETKNRCKSNGGEVISNKTCYKHIGSTTCINATSCSNHKSVPCSNTRLPCALNSNEVEIPQTMDILGCCSQAQHFSSRKSIPKCERPVHSNSGLGESRKSEPTYAKEIEHRNILKNMKILCPNCWKKTCVCDFPGKKYKTNSPKNGNDSVRSENSPGKLTENGPLKVTENIYENLNGSIDEMSSIREYLKHQDKKINSLHEKVSSFLSQHASCCSGQSPKGNGSSNETESDIPYILNILEVHIDKIKELEEEINLLKSSERKSSPDYSKHDESLLNQSPTTTNCVNVKTCNKDIHCPYSHNVVCHHNKNDESILNQVPTTNCGNVKTCNKDIHYPCSHNIVCHEQRQKVTKTSTSTMTSFAMENGDKLVYRKQMTVVSDIMREKKESSHSPKDISPKAQKHLDEKNANLNSHKKKSHKLNKHSPNLKSRKNMSSNSSSDMPDSIDNQVLKTSNKSERKSKHGAIRNKETIDKRRADWASDNDIEEQKNTPILRTSAARHSHPRSSKEKQNNRTSPKTIDLETIRNPRNKVTPQISTSSSSTDTEYDSPKQRERVSDSDDSSTTIKRYGLTPGDLSVATKNYLDSYGLNLDKNDRTESSRKTSKRYNM